MSRIIIGIHGLANKPPDKVLRKWWAAAIREGLLNNHGIKNPQLTFESVFWAHKLYDPLQNETKMEEPYLKAKPGSLKRYNDWWMDDLVAGGMEVVGTTLDFLKQRFDIDALADTILKAKLKDLYAYYANEAKRVELRSLLQERLEKNRDKKIMLIAHSMGSIIAYDVLRTMGRDDPSLKIHHFITIGSPLGLPHVKNKILQESKIIRTPSNVLKWTNFADRKDIVSLDVHLADDYASNDSGVRVRDDLVINSYKGKKGGSNHHKSYGYLRTPEMSDEIKRFI